MYSYMYCTAADSLCLSVCLSVCLSAVDSDETALCVQWSDSAVVVVVLAVV